MSDFVLVSIADGTFACVHCSETPVDTSRHSCDKMLEEWARLATPNWLGQSDETLYP